MVPKLSYIAVAQPDKKLQKRDKKSALSWCNLTDAVVWFIRENKMIDGIKLQMTLFSSSTVERFQPICAISMKKGTIRPGCTQLTPKQGVLWIKFCMSAKTLRK